ncbi:hypothetical protein N7541_001365 [Penicillium brevicompactum]|uniref:Uncharacterized protein n=1 Tax=Penicillium brevicompactum TaxID=5074 RepID=A0A9W9RXZ3_PENBR|nr:hypothetical protein N7541_001365 [Penicillium brevicompactum]
MRLFSALSAAGPDDWVSRVIDLARNNAERRDGVIDALNYHTNLRHLVERIAALAPGSLEAECYRSLIQEWVLSPPS